MDLSNNTVLTTNIFHNYNRFLIHLYGTWKGMFNQLSSSVLIIFLKESVFAGQLQSIYAQSTSFIICLKRGQLFKFNQERISKFSVLEF